MRIIAGRYGGRTLTAPRGASTRPTSDRVREALFSILGSAVPGAHVLDLFAGSGALGLEARSRGAAAVTFVDDDRAAIAAIRANLDALGEAADVRRIDALRFLSAAAGNDAQYDLVFLDPPYRLAERLAPPLSTALPAVLAPGAMVVAECDRRAPLDLALPLTDERRYGDTLIRIHGS
ncbi:MAG TPA: 16S rRNA (guanine(966)-N(2))-methyltransferase RsmD [Solirubrobacter sp.]|nr:16S rRNA (guanine(966)-N(2))-methyltransferase RsmD [Solirubrobacter sp.]